MPAPVLIVIDMLNDFLDRWPPPSRTRLIDSINELVASIRQAHGSIIWVRQEFEPDLSDAFPEMKTKGMHVTIRGTRGCQIDSNLAVQSTDPVVIKKRYSAFFGTNLDRLFAELNPNPLILAGINTHACVRMTAIDAYQRDIRVILAADCVDSYDREHHEVSIRYMKDKIASLMTNEEIRSSLSLPGSGS
jgi:nicotinamidase-related amidase